MYKMYTCACVGCISYPDDDHKSDRNMLVINNVWWNMFYIVHLLVLLHKFK